jgi:hypothetical protein
MLHAHYTDVAKGLFLVLWWVPTSKRSEEVYASTENQGCQIVYFQTKNPNSGKFQVS